MNITTDVPSRARSGMVKAGVVLMALIILAGATAPIAEAADTDITVYVGDAELEDGRSHISGGTTYVSLRTVSEALGAAVTWSGATQTATVTAENLKLTVKLGEKYMVANGRYLYLDSCATMQGGSLFVPVHQLCRAFGATVAWSEQNVYITPGSSPIAAGSVYYDDTDLYWLSRIIHAESRGEVLEGKIGVGNVVMNRVKSSQFPNNVYGVVFDRRCGVQFTPAYSGAINCTPSSESVIAAKLVLDGASTVGEALYFNANYLATSSWAAKNRPYLCTIGGHSFYC